MPKHGERYSATYPPRGRYGPGSNVGSLINFTSKLAAHALHSLFRNHLSAVKFQVDNPRMTTTALGPPPRGCTNTTYFTTWAAAALPTPCATGHQDAKAQSMQPWSGLIDQLRPAKDKTTNKLVREQIVRLVSWFIKAQGSSNAVLTAQMSSTTPCILRIQEKR